VGKRRGRSRVYACGVHPPRRPHAQSNRFVAEKSLFRGAGAITGFGDIRIESNVLTDGGHDIMTRDIRILE
jgi:hypothetical protein